MDSEKRKSAEKLLELAVAEMVDDTASEELRFLALSKAFEVTVEETWKTLKRHLEDEGLEVTTPKSVFREAARAGLIDNPAQWLAFVDNRNISVHSYFTVQDKDKLRELASELLGASKDVARALRD